MRVAPTDKGERCNKSCQHTRTSGFIQSGQPSKSNYTHPKRVSVVGLTGINRLPLCCLIMRLVLTIFYMYRNSVYNVIIKPNVNYGTAVKVCEIQLQGLYYTTRLENNDAIA